MGLAGEITSRRWKGSRSAERITVGGHERLIILIGERHIKTSDDTQRFKAVLDTFHFHGIEGIDTSRYWVSKELARAINYKPVGEMTEGSSITAVEIRSLKQKNLAGVKLALALEIKAGVRQMSDVVATIESGQLESELWLKLHVGKMSSLQKRIWREVLEEFDRDDMKASVEQAVAVLNAKPGELPVVELDNGLPARAAPIHVFRLESQYQPSLLVQIQATMALMAPHVNDKFVCLAAACITAVSSVLASHDLWNVMDGLIGYGAPKAAALLLQFGGQGFTAVNARNAFMMKTLTTVLEDNPQIDKIVVTVGQAHVPGRLKILRRQGV